MALLQDGKIFYIKCGERDYEDEFGTYDETKYYEWFVQQFSEALNITDSEYSTVKYINDGYGNELPYFLLPYINKNTEEKLVITFGNGYFTGRLYLAKICNNSIYFLNHNAYIKNSFVCKTVAGDTISGISDVYFNYCTLIVDTRFLDSHGFYSIGLSTGIEKTLENYVAPNVFVCDVVNKFNNNRTDGVFSFLVDDEGATASSNYPRISSSGSGYINRLFSSPSVSILLADDNGGRGFVPQVFTKDENSFSIIKLHFGKWKPKKDIYLTSLSTNSTLGNFCNYQNMLDEKDSWKEVIREDVYGNKRTFLFGNGGGTSYWIPVIEAIKEPFALKFSSDENFSLSVANPHWDGVIEYSKDKGKTWVEWNGKRLNGDAEQSIYLRGTGNTRITGHNTPLNNSATYDKPYRWDFTGKYIKGNIETLLDYKIVQKGNHPSMGDYCYRALFYECSSLREAPELPAIELKNYCYTRMFMGCTSLLAAPELPSTKLATYCYGNMFFACNSLTKSPELPATTLAPFCYIGMFQFCNSFVKVPKLPALIMAESCYESMFFGCSILNEVPELPATTLAKRCYDEMFVQCYALTKMPKLPATSLAYECYRYMFLYCSKIKISTTTNQTYSNSYRIPMSGTGTNATNALYYMFYGTGGSFTGTPTINRTYYTSNEVV